VNPVTVDVSFRQVDPEEIKVAVNNLGMKAVFLTKTPNDKPEILFLGYVPESETPFIFVSLYLYKDEKGNKCPILCGAVTGDGETVYTIELLVDPKHLRLFLNKTIKITFCEKVREIKGSELVCENPKSFRLIGAPDKRLVEELIEEMRNPGDVKGAWEDYRRRYKRPICIEID
jgi:hypothetical protein